MGWLDYLLLALVAAGVAAAVIRLRRHGSGCCGCGDCTHCGGDCAHCGEQQHTD